MSKNLVELIRRHHEQDAPTALEVLKEAVDDHGEITDDDRRVAAERSGLPEAAVYGVSTFYDDLLQPRGARHVRVCTGTACFAATARRARRRAARGARPRAGRAPRRRRGLAGRDRLPGLLPLLARRSATATWSTPGRARSSASLAGARAAAAEPPPVEPAGRAGAHRGPATGRACARALASSPRGAAGGGQGGRRARPRRRRLPGRAPSGSSPAPARRRPSRSSSSPTATRATPAPTSTSA